MGKFTEFMIVLACIGISLAVGVGIGETNAVDAYREQVCAPACPNEDSKAQLKEKFSCVCLPRPHPPKAP